MADKKYYWLRLKRDFFKRHDIQVIESMPNGKDYVLFYLKLMVESIDHEGALRFSDTIPYNEQMLSIITGTNIDVVRSAMKLFRELNMIDVLDDSTIYMNEVNTLIGSETKWAEKKRLYRQKEDNVRALSSGSPPDVRQEKEKELEIDKELEIEGEKKTAAEPPVPLADFSKTTFSDEMVTMVESWIKYKKERRETYKPTGLSNLIAEIQNNVNKYGEDAVMELMRQCMAANYRGIIFDRLKEGAKKNGKGNDGNSGGGIGKKHPLIGNYV